MYQLRLETSKQRSVLGEDKVFLSFPALVQELRDQIDCHLTGESLSYVITHTSWEILNKELIEFLEKSKLKIIDLSDGYQLVKKLLPTFTVSTGPGILIEKFLAKGFCPWTEFLSKTEYDRILRWKLRRGYLRNPAVVVQGYDYELIGVGKYTRKYSKSK